MLYDAYVVKMKKLVKLRNLIIKYRFLILACMFLCFASVSTFLLSIGKVNITTDCQKEIVYGESLNFQAKAFLKSVTYEYSNGRSKWSENLPTAPGSYEVRAVSKGIFGNLKYSESQEFEIIPRDVTLTVMGYNYNYGDDIKLDGSLISGDTASIVGFTTNVADIGRHTIPQDVDITIINKDGQDVSSCYNVTFEETEVSINKRQITINVTDAEKVYDGTPLSSDSYTISSGSLFASDSLKMHFDAFLTTVSSITNLPTVAVLNESGKDVTKFYNIRVNAGNLTITKATLNITTNSGVFEYDGKDHQVLDYEVSDNFYSIFKGFRILVSENEEHVMVNTYANRLTFTVLNASGVDVSDFFNIVQTPGKIEITKRSVQIETGSITTMYTGLNIEHKEIASSNGLLSGHSIVVLSETNTNKINVGRHDNMFTVKIVDATGNTVTGNYNITYKYGVVEITKRPITVESTSNTYIYNGTKINHKEFIISSSIGLASTDVAAVLKYTDIENVGTVINEIEIKIFNANSYEDSIGNYDITYKYGTITVNKRPIIVQTSTSEHVYDDTEYFDETFETIGVYGIVELHTVKTQNVPTIKYVGQIENAFTISIFDYANNDVTTNYDITYEYGMISVIKRDVVFKTKDIQKEYDGQVLKDETHDLKELPNLVSNHTYKISGPYGEITNVGEVENTLTVTDILDSSNKSVIDNYNIIYEYGILKVVPRKITIESGSAEKIYDGLAFSCEKTSVVDNKLLKGHQYKASGFISVTDAGIYENTFAECYIYDEFNQDVTYNYEIIKVYGTLTIHKRLIKLNSLDATKVYDGYDLYNREYELVDSSLVSGHTLTIIDSTRISYVVSSHNVFNEYLVVDSQNNDVTNNYEFKQLRMGNLTITPRPVTFLTASNTFIYNGLDQYDDSYKIISEYGIAETDTIINTIPTYAKNVGTYQNKVEYIIDNQYNITGTSNYDITYKYGTITIETRNVSLKPVDMILEYDGKWHQPTEVECLSELNICDIHTCNITFDGQIKNVGTVTTSIRMIQVYDENGENVTKNYRFGNKKGFIEITHKALTLTSEVLEKVYDGKPLSSANAKYELSEVFEDFEYIVLVEQKEIVNVGTISYRHLIEKIIDSEGEDATSNFIIDYIDGTLTITPRPINVVTGNYEKVYDGTPLRSIDFEPIQEINLVEGHTFTWSDDYTSITNVGEVQNKLVIATIVDADGNDVIGNYDIFYQYGILKITPRVLLILTATDEKIYDDTPLFNTNYELLTGSLVGDDKLINISSTSIIYYNEKPVDNVLEFYVEDGNTSMASSNYLLQYQYGTLQILKRYLEVTTDSKEFVYTSENVDVTGYTIVNIDNLVSGQTHSAKRYEEIIYVGTYENKLELEILNAAELNVAYCYDINYTYGTINVVERVIDILTKSATKEYDGEPLFCKEYETSSNYPEPNNFAIGPNDYIETIEFTQLVHVGIVDNVLTFVIKNKKGEDVTANYIYSLNYGTLEVTNNANTPDEPDARITFNTTSKRTYYTSSKQVWTEDGITVTNNKTNYSSSVSSSYYPVYFKIDSSLKVEYADGIKKLVIECSSNLTNDLSVPNASVTRSGKNYIIVFNEEITEWTMSSLPFQLNVLEMEIYSEQEMGEEPPIDIENPGKGNGGNLTTPGTSEEENEKREIVIFKFVSDLNGLVYFREQSFGDYVLQQGFVSAPCFDFASYDFNPIYLTSKILEEYGYDTNNVEVEIILDNQTYLLPYFATNYNSEGTDSLLDLVFSGKYSLQYIDFNILNTDQSFKTKMYQEYELAYRNFVYENYLQVPNGLKEVLNKHINLGGIIEDSPTVIQDVVNYVKNHRKYDLSVKYPSGVDHVAYFLESAEAGICQQFAATATMMFRQLGIPARYTIGYAANSFADKEQVVKAGQYHAWVEIYIDGLGWVIVDPTGSTQGGNNQEPEPEKIKLSIKPLDRMKEYDGTPLLPYGLSDINTNGISQIIEGLDQLSLVTLQNLFEEGYYYDITIDGSQTDVGLSESNIISFTLYDPNGNDVTDNYEITYESGSLEVVAQLIELKFYNQTKYYTGDTYSYTSDMVYDIIGLPTYYSSFTYDIVGTITNVGELKAEITNIVLLDRYGNNIADNYRFNCVGKIEVRQRKLIIQTQSASKDYDGKPLTNNKWWIQMGELVEGHVIDGETISSITEVGSIDNEMFIAQIRDNDGNDVSINYNIEIKTGTLTVTENE